MFVEVCHQHDNAEFSTPRYTINRMQEAISMKAEILFLSLARSKDGTFFAADRDRLENVSNGAGSVGDYTAEQLKRMRIKQRGRLTAKGFVTFEDMLKLGKGKIMFKVDGSIQEYAQEFSALMDRLDAWESVILDVRGGAEAMRRRYGDLTWNRIRSGEAQIMVVSGSRLAEFAAVAPECSIWGWNVDLQKNGLLNVPQRVVAGFVYGAGEAGRTDDEAGWEKALKEGVTVFRTNRPKELVNFLKKRKRRNW